MPRVLRGAELRLNLRNLLGATTYDFFRGSEGPTSAHPGRPREVVVTLRYEPRDVPPFSFSIAQPSQR